jgi:RNA recognition motif-containing protein
VFSCGWTNPLGFVFRPAWFFQEAQVAKKLYVGNLPYGVSSSDLERVFQAHGTVESAQVIVDRDTGRSKGFGFVEMRNDQEAQDAIQALNGQDFNGRSLTVNEARPREERSGGRREFGGSRASSGYGGSRRW